MHAKLAILAAVLMLAFAPIPVAQADILCPIPTVGPTVCLQALEVIAPLAPAVTGAPDIIAGFIKVGTFPDQATIPPGYG